MKTNLPLPSALRRSLLRVALAATAISTFSSPAWAVTASSPGSPVGTWDCIMNGARTGVAYLTFSNDFTFTASEVIVPKGPPLPSTPSTTDRGQNTGLGRNPESNTSNSNSTSSVTAIFGFETVTNNWTFDNQGRVFGFFAEQAAGPCTTNYVTITNFGIIYTNFPVVTCSSLTNQISFLGKVVPGKRINLVCSTPNGKVTYRGVPANTTLTDFSGTYYATEKQKGPPSYINEIFSLSLMTNAPIPNAYAVVNLMGPSYSNSFAGVALVSSQKKMGFVSTNSASPNLRAVNGGFNLNKARGTLNGWDQPAAAFTNHVTFKLVKQ